MTKPERAWVDAIKRAGCLCCLERGYPHNPEGPMVEIPGMPDYWVSEEGVVATTKWGRGSHGVRVMRQSTTPRGYRRIQFRVGGRAPNIFVHAVVALAFLGPRAPGMQINHKDGDKAHNCLRNIEYATRAQNMAHAVATGLTMAGRLRGEAHPASKYSTEQVRVLREKYEALRAKGRPPYGSVKRLAEEVGMPVSTLEKMVSRTAWASV